MRTERISELSNRIFNTNLSEPITKRTSNPFAGTPSMSGGSMIKLNPELFVKADVFAEKSGTSNRLGIKEKLTQSSKRIYSTFVGSINDFGERFYQGFEAMREFGAKIKNNIVSAFNKVQEIGNTEITFSGIGKSIAALVPAGVILWNSRERQVDNLSKRSPAELSEMLVSHLEKLEEANSIMAVA